MSLYDILGVKKTATISEIRIAYHKLARSYHPDKNPDDATRMEEINNAYAILKNPTQRAEYDQQMHYQRKEIPDFVDMRKAAKDFFEPIKNIKKEEFEKQKKDAEVTFKREMEQMNQHNGITKDASTPIQNIDDILENFQLTRKQEDIEIMPDINDNLRHLPTKDFNQKFNEEFEKNIENQLAMIGYKEPEAYIWNGQGQFDDAAGALIDDDTIVDIHKPVDINIGVGKTMKAGNIKDEKPLTHSDMEKLIAERDKF
jgi:curved DNA-binding protein CbpA